MTTTETKAIAKHDGTDLSHLSFDPGHNVQVSGVKFTVNTDGKIVDADDWAELPELSDQSPYVTCNPWGKHNTGHLSFYYGYAAIDAADDARLTRPGALGNLPAYLAKLATIKQQVTLAR